MDSGCRHLLHDYVSIVLFQVLMIINNPRGKAVDILTILNRTRESGACRGTGHDSKDKYQYHLSEIPSTKNQSSNEVMLFQEKEKRTVVEFDNHGRYFVGISSTSSFTPASIHTSDVIDI